MSTVEEQNQSTSTKLDGLANQLKDIAGWLKKVDEMTQGLAASTSLLQLQAEDTASRLGILESSRVHRPVLGASSTSAPPTAEVRVDTNQRPNGHGSAPFNRRQVPGINRSTELPPSNGTSLNGAGGTRWDNGDHGPADAIDGSLIFERPEREDGWREQNMEATCA